MRFSIVVPSIFLFLLLSIVNVAAVEPVNELLTSDDIDAQIIHNYLLKREEVATAVASTNGTATATGKAATTTTSTGPVMIGKSVQAVPAVLQTGTLFYIGISVTTLLWVTGKVIDVKMERQERYAESLVHSI